MTENTGTAPAGGSSGGSSGGGTAPKASGGTSGGGGRGGRLGGELRNSCAVKRATAGLDADVVISTKTRSARKPAGGSFGMLQLLTLFDAHGPNINIKASGPDADIAYERINAVLNGQIPDNVDARRLPPYHDHEHPHSQAAGLTFAEYKRALAKVPMQDMVKLRTLSTRAIEEYLAAPDDVRKHLLAEIPDPGTA